MGRECKARNFCSALFAGGKAACPRPLAAGAHSHPAPLKNPLKKLGL